MKAFSPHDKQMKTIRKKIASSQLSATPVRKNEITDKMDKMITNANLFQT